MLSTDINYQIVQKQYPELNIKVKNSKSVLSSAQVQRPHQTMKVWYNYSRIGVLFHHPSYRCKKGGITLHHEKRDPWVYGLWAPNSRIGFLFSQKKCCIGGSAFAIAAPLTLGTLPSGQQKFTAFWRVIPLAIGVQFLEQPSYILFLCP